MRLHCVFVSKNSDVQMITQGCFARLKTQFEYMFEKNVTCLHPTLTNQESSEASLSSAP